MAGQGPLGPMLAALLGGGRSNATKKAEGSAPHTGKAGKREKTLPHRSHATTHPGSSSSMKSAKPGCC